jgi:general secretion pathway protein E
MSFAIFRYTVICSSVFEDRGDYMQISSAIMWLGASYPADLSVQPAVVGANELFGIPLTFNPVRMLLLIGWVYLCLYCVQQVEFGALVSKNRKGIANVATLLTGPILLLVLLIADLFKRPASEHHGVWKTITQGLQDVGRSIRESVPIGSRPPPIRLLDSSGTELKQIYGHGKKGQDSHVLSVTEQMVWDALQDRASDILIDPKTESIYTIRFRVDGVLREIERMEAGTCQAVVNSIKAVAGMDIAEKRRPQDGAFIAKTNDGTISFRVASAGVLNGEKLSIRVLNQDASMFTLESIGLMEKQKAIIETAITKPSGMILMCGPTGSGKTTTLYAMLNNIDFYTRNVITVEDPIEYVLPNTSQIEVNPKADITFANSLRSILRQDPDVICVGEIRDEETAAIALQASQTGHLVLATLHSDSSASAMIRLLDLGVTPLLMSSGLSLIVSQRLVRKLCKYCKMPAQLTQAQIRELERKKVNYSNIFQAVGCDRCHQTGYYGRTAIYDLLTLDENLKAAIANNAVSITALRKEGEQRGKSNLQKQGLLKVVSGVTSLEELARVVG